MNNDDQAPTTSQAAGVRRPISRRTLLRSVAVGTGVLGSGAWLSACSAGSASTGGSGSSSGKQLSLLVLGPSQQAVSYLNDEALASFSDSTGISVSMQQSDWGSGFQKVVTAAASGTLPDVVMLGGIWVAPLASKKALLGIDDLLAGYGEKSAYVPAALEDCSYDGSTYALPVYSDTRTAMYRRSLLVKAGADPDELPRTWQDYAALGRQLAKGADLPAPVDWGIDKSVGLQQSFAQLLFQAGGTYYDDSGHAVLSSDQGVAALEYLMGFYRDKLASADMVNNGTGPTPFVAGRSAMIFSGTSSLSNAQQNQPAAVADIVAGPPLASTDGGKPTTSAWINKLGIAASTKNRDGAWQLLQHLCAKPVATRIGELYGGLPTRTDITGTPFLATMPKALVQAAQDVVPQPPSPNMLAIAPQMNTFLQQAIRLQGSAESILKDMDGKLDELNGV